MTGLVLVVASAGSAHANGSDPAQLEVQSPPQAAKAKDKHKRDEVEVAGDFTVVHSGPPTVTQVAPDLCIIELNPSFVFAGDLDGSFTSLFIIEHAGPCDQPAAEYFSTDGVFEGRIDGKQGSFEYTFEGTIDEQGIATGAFDVVEDTGTKRLERVEGAMTMIGLAGVEGSYAGTFEL